MKCSNNVKKDIDGFLDTDTSPGWLVIRTSHTSIYIFQNWVLPHWQYSSDPSSHVCKVFNPSHIQNITRISKTIQCLYSDCCDHCFAPLEDPPTLIAWFMIVTFCWVYTLHGPCIHLRYQRSNIIGGYKNKRKHKQLRYDCRACFSIFLWWIEAFSRWIRVPRWH